MPNTNTRNNTFTPPEFHPRGGLANGHMMTLAGNFLPRKNLLPPPDDRIITVDEKVGARVLCHCHWQPQREQAMTAVIVHGLEGSSDSKYVIGTGGKLWRKGMNIVRMNMRTCGGTELLTPTLYHNGMSNDLLAVTRSLAASDGLKRFALIGFSMGGNLVMRSAGELGDAAPDEIVAIAGVSPAMDLGPSAAKLHEPKNILYEWKFLHGLVERFRRKAKLHPELYDITLARGNGSIIEFDDRITARYGGFHSADDYYEQCSSSRVAHRIKVPALVIQSLDDPFIVMTEKTRATLQANRNITLIETQHGGHCAFLSEANGEDDGRWAENTVRDFLTQFDIDPSR